MSLAVQVTDLISISGSNLLCRLLMGLGSWDSWTVVCLLLLE